MSIDATTNYISSYTIDTWMELKTEGLYGDMGQAMDVSNERASAEEELNKIKAMLADAKNHGGDVTAVQAEITAALAEYKDIPELVTALTPIAQDITEATPDTGSTGVAVSGSTTVIQAAPAPTTAPAITVGNDQIDDWTKAIGDVVDGLGKQDQLGLINIQEFNSEINQAKQIASALLDSTSKTADAIINHIS